ncbi:MAG: hypothetical protein LQ346_002063 [Caloplaca aetnensis]|nr:MAG: hypothetical protein LQ346_002063 [Caloplaca aetnensis]
MDYIKSSLGYGAQSGQEPISGETGKGTPDQPYDAGNVAGQSGAPAAEATSTNPTGATQYDTGTAAHSTGTAGERTDPGANNSGTTQFDTGETPNTNATDSNTRETGTLNTTENLAAGVTSGDSTTDSLSRDSTSGAASKGTDESRGADEQVRSSQTGPVTDSQTNAQDTFFQNANVDKNKPAASPNVPDEITNKDPFGSSSGANDTSSETVANTEGNIQPAAPPISSTTDSTTSDASAGASQMSAEKNYRTADTEPHPQSSEVLSSATPGAAIGSAYPTSDQPSSGLIAQPSNDVSTASASDITTTTGAAATSTTTAPSTTTRAAADTDYPSPKTQPSEAQGGLSGISHNTGNAPTAPNTGSDAVEDPSLGASQGQGPNKKKMGDRIKEKLHIGKKNSE